MLKSKLFLVLAITISSQISSAIIIAHKGFHGVEIKKFGPIRAGIWEPWVNDYRGSLFHRKLAFAKPHDKLELEVFQPNKDGTYDSIELVKGTVLQTRVNGLTSLPEILLGARDFANPTAEIGTYILSFDSFGSNNGSDFFSDKFGSQYGRYFGDKPEKPENLMAAGYTQDGVAFVVFKQIK